MLGLGDCNTHQLGAPAAFWSANEVLELMLEFSSVDDAAAVVAAVIADVVAVGAAAAATAAASAVAAAGTMAAAVATGVAGAAVALEFIWFSKSVPKNVVDMPAVWAVAGGAAGAATLAAGGAAAAMAGMLLLGRKYG